MFLENLAVNHTTVVKGINSSSPLLPSYAPFYNTVVPWFTALSLSLVSVRCTIRSTPLFSTQTMKSLLCITHFPLFRLYTYNPKPHLQQQINITSPLSRSKCWASRLTSRSLQYGLCIELEGMQIDSQGSIIEPWRGFKERERERVRRRERSSEQGLCLFLAVWLFVS